MQRARLIMLFFEYWCRRPDADWGAIFFGSWVFFVIGVMASLGMHSPWGIFIGAAQLGLALCAWTVESKRTFKSSDVFWRR